MTPKNPFGIYNSDFGSKKSSKRASNLAWEEGALFEAQDPDDYYEGHENDPKPIFYVAILGLCFLVLVVRLFYLQVNKGDYYRALADNNRLRIQDILAPRGIVFDSQDKPLVDNIPSFELVVTPVDLPKQNTDEEFNKLKSLVDFDIDALKQGINSKGLTSFQSVSVVQNMLKEVAVQFESRAAEFPGFSIEHNPIRKYIDPLIFSHVLGYTGKITDKELAAHKDGNYAFNDYIGKTGLEVQYEEYLRGTPGKKQIEVDASGKIKSDRGEVQPQPGQSLVLNIDGDLQRELYKQIVARNGNRKAAAVALNPQTGQVLALVSMPGFDNNLFSQGISQKDYQALITDPKQPLFNRTISGTYPPGSTIKPVIASAALQEKVVDDKTIIYDNGSINIGKFIFRGWKPEGLGPMDVRSAIAWSSDIYFYTVGGGQAGLNISGLGPERMGKYDYLFGMGQTLGIDLPGEQPGLVAGPDWKKKYFSDPDLQVWYPGDTYHIAIGQGDMLATPLQVAMWTSVVANGGTLYRPYILDKVLDGAGKTIFQNESSVIRADFIDPINIEIVREGMRQTVTSGTARSLSSLPITAAGKTGTAQFDGANPEATHAWFTAFAPYDNPKIVITVLIEAGGEGSSAASPVVKETLKWWADNRYNK